MSSSITQAALDVLARRLDELAAGFPTGPAAIDLVALTDDIGMLTHHLQQAAERAQERFTAPQFTCPNVSRSSGSPRPPPAPRAPWTCSPRP
ncbi:hypothetical protein [Streptomyces sp. NPDC047042]|uniref:hypothetical protein n=1 Tax=Streptomyces sp. NPDC047042 TaxID=3154807 RepID=UPI0034060893